MADTPPPTSWTRVLLAVTASAVLLFLILAGSMWFILAEEGVAPPTRAAVEHAGRVVRTGGADAEAAQDAIAGDRLVVDVVDTQGEPAPGVTLVLSDGRGGPVRVENDDGTPFGGRVRDPKDGWITLDAAGRADLPNRLCGRTRIRVSEPKGTPGRAVTWEPARVEGDEEVVLVPPPVATAEVRVVDEDGALVDVSLHPGEALGVGRYGIRGRDADVRLRIRRPEQQGFEVRIPLDGGVHEVVAPLDRTVALTLVCGDCPQAVSCVVPGVIASHTTCTGSPPDLTCSCPGGDALVVGRSASAMTDTLYSTQPLGEVPVGETTATIDISGGRGSIEATWTGAVPCEVRLERAGHPATAGDACRMDGGVLVSDLVPGEWTLTVADMTGARVRRTLVLEGGEARDLGPLAPEERGEQADTGG